MRVLQQRFVAEQPINGVHEHPNNARRGDEEFLAESIEVSGFFGCIVVDERNGNILVGNHRYRMLARAGGTTIPTLFITPDDDAHATRVMLSDNAGADRATNDAGALIVLLEAAKNSTVGLRGTGYDEEALAVLVNAQRPQLPQPGDAPIETLPSLWGVIIECADEREQVAALEKLGAGGYRVRALLGG